MIETYRDAFTTGINRFADIELWNNDRDVRDVFITCEVVGG